MTQSNKAAPKILIADDDPFVLRAIAARCAKIGFEVETASCGLKAVIRTGQFKPDLLVVDVHLPEVDGLSICELLREHVAQLPRLMVVTGQRGVEITERCRDLGACLIEKGDDFWNEFETRLAEMFPEKEFPTRSPATRASKAKLKARPRVLFVDDDPSVRALFLFRFGQLGADLLFAADGNQGYWKARRQEPTVIVSDYCMPNCNAEYLLERLRSSPETSSIPVIVQTAKRLSPLIRERLQRTILGQPGAARIIRKSFEAAELFEALQRVCGFAGDLNGERLYR